MTVGQKRIRHPFCRNSIEQRLGAQPGSHLLGVFFGQQPLDDLDLPGLRKAPPRFAQQRLVREFRGGLVALELAPLVAFEIESCFRWQFQQSADFVE